MDRTVLKVQYITNETLIPLSVNISAEYTKAADPEVIQKPVENIIIIITTKELGKELKRPKLRS